MGGGLTSQTDLPAIPGGNCGGAFDSCNSNFLDGTAQAGVMVALNNTIGIVGIAHGIPPAKIYSWRILLPNNTYDGNLYAAGINQAISLGTKTLVIDLHHIDYLAYEANLIGSAWAAGIITVTHVGSGGQYYANLYPASLPNVVSVAGVRQDGSFAANPTSGCTAGGGVGSNWGPMVKLAAPFWAYTIIAYLGGGGYYGDTRSSIGYCRTSLSAAHVAAIIALLQDKYPTWSPTQIVQQLTATASHPGSLDPYIGYGIPNAYLALAGPPPPPPLSGVTIDGPSQVLSQATCTWTADPQGGTAPFQYSWTVNSGPVISQDPSLTYTNLGQPFTIALQVTDAIGAGAGNTKFVDILLDAEECIQ